MICRIYFIPMHAYSLTLATPTWCQLAEGRGEDDVGQVTGLVLSKQVQDHVRNWLQLTSDLFPCHHQTEVLEQNLIRKASCLHGCMCTWV